jgi:hypothetical protein
VGEKEVTEDIERFKVRHEVRWLRSRFGLRRYRLYFTDKKVYLVETFLGWGSSLGNPAIPLRILISPLIAGKSDKQFESMLDIRLVINECKWYKRYMLDELKSVWIEPGEKVNRLVFDIQRKEERPEMYAVSGEGIVYFKEEHAGEIMVRLQKAIPDIFKGIREGVGK